MPGRTVGLCLRITRLGFARTRPRQTCSCPRRALHKGFCRSATVNHAINSTRQLDLNMPLTSPNVLVELVARAGIEPATFRFSGGGGVRSETLVLVKLDELDPS